VLQNDLAKSLALADEAVVAGVFRSDVIPEAERMDVSALVSQVQKLGGHARVVADVDTIVQSVAPEMRSGDVIAILSNGGFGGIYEKLPQRLKSLAGKQSSKEATAQA
jgi:UDP-N-acetylmuramate: L-alanyl-gamma-D-glutamyl-meso-diaminopimelate ligase